MTIITMPGYTWFNWIRYPSNMLYLQPRTFVVRFETVPIRWNTVQSGFIFCTLWANLSLPRTKQCACRVGQVTFLAKKVLAISIIEMTQEVQSEMISLISKIPQKYMLKESNGQITNKNRVLSKVPIKPSRKKSTCFAVTRGLGLESRLYSTWDHSTAVTDALDLQVWRSEVNKSMCMQGTNRALD